MNIDGKERNVNLGSIIDVEESFEVNPIENIRSKCYLVLFKKGKEMNLELKLKKKRFKKIFYRQK